jgi:hypothetical protein
MPAFPFLLVNPGDGHTTPAAVRKNFSRFLTWRPSSGEGATLDPKNESKLSEIILEINNLRGDPFPAQLNHKKAFDEIQPPGYPFPISQVFKEQESKRS